MLVDDDDYDDDDDDDDGDDDDDEDETSLLKVVINIILNYNYNCFRLAKFIYVNLRNMYRRMCFLNLFRIHETSECLPQEDTRWV